MNKPKIIYFLKDGIPSVAEKEEAESFGVKVMYRNVRFIEPEDFPEECDAVAGVVIPEQYADKPGPDKVLGDYAEFLKSRRELTGDTPAPETQQYADEKEAVAATVDKVKNPAIKAPKAGGWSKGK